MKLETFGQRLRWARQNHAKITQTELAKRMKDEFKQPVGKNYISELEKEEAQKRPSFEMVRAMAAVMKVSLDFFGRFTETLEPTYGKEQGPHYFSEEADEVAKLVDAMYPEQRTLLLNLANSMANAPSERQRERMEIRDNGMAMLNHPDVATANAWLRRHFVIYVKENMAAETRLY